jgi:glycerophosphoryl diester phosphodiesterase
MIALFTVCSTLLIAHPAQAHPAQAHPAQAHPAQAHPARQAAPPAAQQPHARTAGKPQQNSPRLPACGALHVVAHRGDRAYTENTVAAFRSAIRAGADAIETDVRTARDDRLVLMHDRTLGRTTTERGRVHMLTGREIHAVRTEDGQRVPYVDAALRFLHNRPRITGVLELKTMTRKSMVRLRRKVVDFKVMSQVTLSSKRVQDLRRAKRIMPHVRRKRLTWQPVRPRFTARIAHGVIIPLHRLGEPRVKRYKRAGLTVTAMASTKRRSRREMAKIGVDALSSNNIPGYVKHCRTPLPEPKPKRPAHASARAEEAAEAALADDAAVAAQKLGRIWVALTLPQTLHA